MTWGLGPWGGGGWGGPVSGGMLLALSVEARSENVLRVTFNMPVYFSGVLDPLDASNPDIWQASPVAGTVGYDGVAARSVMVVTVEAPADLVNVPVGSVLDLTLDRPMTPYPAAYQLATLSAIASADQSQQMAATSIGQTPALFRVLNPPDPTAAAPGRDLANPQTLSGAIESAIVQPQVAPLGSFGVSGDGDYAFDSRDTGLRKRLNRRFFTRKGGFLHLGQDFGVGVLQRVKRLGRASERQQLAADCEVQFAQEPEVAQVQVLSRLDPLRPNFVKMSVFIKKKNGRTAKFQTNIAMQ